MAVGVLAAAPEFNRQVYDNITEKMYGHSPMRADEAPEGLILHSAGQGEQGFYVYDVWESRETFERFMEERLGPAMAEVMGGPPPEGGAPQFFPIDVLVTPGWAWLELDLEAAPTGAVLVFVVGSAWRLGMRRRAPPRFRL